MTEEKWIESIRDKEGYKEMEAALTEVVRTQDLISHIEASEKSDRLSEIKNDADREVVIDEWKDRLVGDLMGMVSDLEDLQSEERIFMMAMVEDIAQRLVSGYIQERLGD